MISSIRPYSLACYIMKSRSMSCSIFSIDCLLWSSLLWRKEASANRPSVSERGSAAGILSHPSCL